MKLANIFDNAKLYELFQFTLSGHKTKAKLRDEVLKPSGVTKVLDFGCGIGYHSREFLDVEYFGIEPLQGCIERANRMYRSEKTTFLVGDHQTLKSVPDSSYDLIIAIGVLHHIDNGVFSNFLEEAYRILKPGGRLTTFDPVFHENQSFLSRWVVSKDRGEYIRTTDEYLAPVEKIFSAGVTHKIYKRLLRIPYDHIHMETLKQQE